MDKDSGEQPLEPTENARDIVQGIRSNGAYGVFILNIARIHQLLSAASTGIDKSKETNAALLVKIKEARNNPSGPIDGPKVKRLEDGMIQLHLTEREIHVIQEVVTWQSDLVDSLHFHLHNVLWVAAWGAFEGYMQARIAEVLTANSHLLSSEKKLSVAEVLAASGSLIEYLVAKEIDDVGRRSFDDLQAYLRSKLQLQFSNEHADQMRQVYFLRNVVAHGAGFLRKDQLQLVPSSIAVERGELRIGQKDLEDAVTCLSAAVQKFEDQLRARFGASLLSE